jgi:hypothetical protein
MKKAFGFYIEIVVERFSNQWRAGRLCRSDEGERQEFHDTWKFWKFDFFQKKLQSLNFWNLCIKAFELIEALVVSSKLSKELSIFWIVYIWFSIFETH